MTFTAILFQLSLEVTDGVIPLVTRSYSVGNPVSNILKIYIF